MIALSATWFQSLQDVGSTALWVWGIAVWVLGLVIGAALAIFGWLGGRSCGAVLGGLGLVAVSVIGLSLWLEDQTVLSNWSEIVLASPWYFILTGVVGMVFFAFLAIYSHSPSVESGPLTILIAFGLSVASTALGIVGLFDYRFVEYAQYLVWAVPKFGEAIAILFGLIMFLVLLYGFVADPSGVRGGGGVAVIILVFLVFAAYVIVLSLVDLLCSVGLLAYGHPALVYTLVPWIPCEYPPGHFYSP